LKERVEGESFLFFLKIELSRDGIVTVQVGLKCPEISAHEDHVPKTMTWRSKIGMSELG